MMAGVSDTTIPGNSLTDPELDAKNFGYRTCPTYRTIASTNGPTKEDYDEWTLFSKTPPATTTSDLGTGMGFGDDLEFDEVDTIDSPSSWPKSYQVSYDSLIGVAGAEDEDAFLDRPFLSLQEIRQELEMVEDVIANETESEY